VFVMAQFFVKVRNDIKINFIRSQRESNSGRLLCKDKLAAESIRQVVIKVKETIAQGVTPLSNHFVSFLKL
jgi:hypothetical protein